MGGHNERATELAGELIAQKVDLIITFGDPAIRAMQRATQAIPIVGMTDDMIGRNGHMRWPEALVILDGLWKELPNSYKYNHQLKRLEVQFDNWDCSKEAFEGIRSQDILPLLIKKFQFDLFLGFANVVDVFVDRSFGHQTDWPRSLCRWNPPKRATEFPNRHFLPRLASL